MDISEYTRKPLIMLPVKAFFGHLLLIAISCPIHRQIFCWHYCFWSVKWIHIVSTFSGVPEEHAGYQARISL